MSTDNTPFSDQPYSAQLKFVKSQARKLHKLNLKDKSRAYYLNLASRRCGYASYNELISKFKQEIWDNIYGSKESACSSRMPDQNRSYYWVTMHDSEEYSYFSEWVDYDDDGFELRVASLINAQLIIDTFRQPNQKPFYVIHEDYELALWRIFWKGRALISSEAVAKDFSSLLIPSKSKQHPRITR